MEYYRRLDVRRTILDFVRANGGSGERECAFYNTRTKGLQRHLSEHPIVLDSAVTFDRVLASGATAFYCSYWRYPGQDFSRPLGHDLVWTVRARRGGLRFAKTVAALMIEALADGGVSEPWVKYSGQLGFDLLIPLETIPNGAWAGDGDTSADLQRGLTSYIASYLTECWSNIHIDGAYSPLKIKRGTDTCILSELWVRRGLLLAPMSLNPESGLVSVPIAPDKVAEFSVLDASPADARVFEWVKPPRVARGLVKYAHPWQLAPVQTKLAIA
jgi:hypothetical protein